MIRNSFLHIPGIGAATERRLWQGGVKDWRDFFAQQAALRFSPGKKDFIRQWLERSESALARADGRFFARALPPGEHWRAFGEFGGRAAFVDIETNGGMDGGDITVVGVFDGRRMQTFLCGENLDQAPDVLAEFPLWVTFNGAQFDLPLLRRRFPRARLDSLHLDLRFALRRLGLRGGLKAIESQLGIGRSAATAGMNGYDAVILWRRHLERNDGDALQTLLAYNREDAEHLLPLATFAYGALRQAVLPHPA